MTLPYGFKAQANRIAVGLRSQMGLTPHSPIDVRALLERLGIDVFPLASFSDICPKQVEQLRRDSGEFSALLLRVRDGERVILVNDDHTPVRQNSSLAHEASHSLLAHSPEVVSTGPGCRNYDRGQEGEAYFLAGCILISNEAARKIVMSGMDLQEARESYGGKRPDAPIQVECQWRQASASASPVLIDSLMQGYPFGEFMFWRVAPDNSSQYRCFDFVREYLQRDDLYCPKLPVIHDKPLTAALHGQ